MNMRYPWNSKYIPDIPMPRQPYRAVAIPNSQVVRQWPMKESPRKDILVKDLFFPVEEHQLFWEMEQDRNREDNPVRHFECPSRYAIVRMDQFQHVFTTVSKSYFLVTNEEAFHLGEEIAKIVFDLDISRFVSYVSEVTAMGAACEISVRREMEIMQPQILDGWRAILRIGNSYNKTKQLTYTFGYEFHNGTILLPQLAIVVKDAHSMSIELVREAVLNQIRRDHMTGIIRDMDKLFADLIASLMQCEMSLEDMLKLYCKVYKLENRDDREKNNFERLDYVNSLIHKYAERYGYRAYAMLFVFGEFVQTYYSKLIGHDLGKDQLQLGKWAIAFTEEVKKQNFSFDDYCGDDASDLVSEYLNSRGR